MQDVWAYGLLGGILSGTASGIYLLGTGRIVGISGMLASLMARDPQDARATTGAFIVGMILLPALVFAFTATPAADFPTSPSLLVAAGFLVGLGARIANGCTSGHGISGLSRFSPRSIAASCLFSVGGACGVLAFKVIQGVL